MTTQYARITFDSGHRNPDTAILAFADQGDGSILVGAAIDNSGYHDLGRIRRDPNAVSTGEFDWECLWCPTHGNQMQMTPGQSTFPQAPPTPQQVKAPGTQGGVTQLETPKRGSGQVKAPCECVTCQAHR